MGTTKTNTKITVNGTEYIIPEITFAVGAQLEELGFNFTDIKGKMQSNVIAFLSLVTRKNGAEELEAHCNNGGKFMSLAEVIFKAVTDSAFFRNLAE